MEIEDTSLWLAKEGSSEEECEDAFFSSRGANGECGLAAYAVADGATESLLSRQWANVLVRSFCRRTSGSLAIDAGMLDQAHMIWARWRSAYLRRRMAEGRPIQWYEEPGFQKGAFATLVGIALLGETFAWTATAIGDACLFLVRRDHLYEAFPLRSCADFGNRPLLLCSRPGHNKKALEGVERVGGSLRVGDRFYLMTDALACWFLRQHEEELEPWRQLEAFGDGCRERAFKDWITDLRSAGLLRNDDVAMTRIQIAAK
jgi:hypothetical protein